MAEENKQKIDELRESVSALSDALQDLKEFFGSTSEQTKKTRESFTMFDEAAQKLAESIQKAQKVQGGLNDELGASTEGFKKVGESQNKMRDGLTDLSSETRSFTEIANKKREQIEQLRRRMDDYYKKLDPVGHAKRELNKALKEFAKENPKVVSGLRALGGAFSLVGTAIRGALGVLGAFTRMVGSLGLALVRLPLNLFREILKFGNELAGIQVRIEQMTQRLIGTFGNLDQGVGRAAQNIISNLQSATGALSDLGITAVGTGSEAATLFGHFIEGSEALQQASIQLVQDFGPLFYRFQQDIEGGAQELILFQRGLGLTGEHLQSFATQAQLSGRSVTEELREVNTTIQSAANAFGVSARDIGQDVGTMRGDFARFGQMSTQTLVNTSVHLRRMGLEIKDVVGLIDGFDDFEKAADAAAMLAQGLGMNVDAMELFTAEDPSERLDILRRSFAETGRSIEDLSRQELRYLAQQSNLDEATLQRAFSQQGLAMTYDELQGAAEDAEEDALSEAQAMRELARSIEMMVTAAPSDGIMGGLVQGFREAFLYAPEFERLRVAFRELGLEAVNFGREIARIFIESNLFSRSVEILENLLDVNRWRDFFRSISTTFRQFVTDFESGDARAFLNLFRNLFGNIQTLFEDVGLGIDWQKQFTRLWTVLRGNFQILWHKMLRPYLVNDLLPSITEGLRKLWEGWPSEEDGEKVFRGLRSILMPVFLGAAALLGSLFVARLVASVLFEVVKQKATASILGWLAGKGTLAAVGKAAIAVGGKFVAGTLAILGGPVTIGLAVAAAAGLAGAAADSFQETHSGLMEEYEGRIGTQFSSLFLGIAQAFGMSDERAEGLFRGFMTFMEGPLGQILSPVILYFDAMTDSLQGVTRVFQGFWEALKGAFTMLKGIFTLDFDVFVDGLAGIASGFGKMLGGIVRFFIALPKQIFKHIGDLVKNVIEGFKAIPEWWEEFSFEEFFSDAWEGASTWLSELPGRLLAAGRRIIGGFVDGVKEGLGMNSPPKVIIDIFEAVVDAIRDVFTNVWSVITLPYRMAWTGVKRIFGIGGESEGEEGEGVFSAFSGMVDTIRNVLSGVTDFITAPFRNAWEFVTGLFSAETWSERFDLIKNAIGNAIDGVKELLLRPFNWAYERIPAFIRRMLPGEEGGAARELITNLREGIESGDVEGIAEALSSPFRRGWQAIRGVFQINSPSEAAQDLVGDIVSGFSGIERMGDVLARPFSSVFDGNIFGQVTERFSRGVSGVAEGVQTIFTERFNQALVANVERITREYNDLDSVLARGLPTIRLSGTLDRFNDAINVARETINIEQRPIQINVELNVKLDADDLALALSDSTITQFPLQPDTDFI